MKLELKMKLLMIVMSVFSKGWERVSSWRWPVGGVRIDAISGRTQTEAEASSDQDYQLWQERSSGNRGSIPWKCVVSEYMECIGYFAVALSNERCYSHSSTAQATTTILAWKGLLVSEKFFFNEVLC
jgi:hypothetical protein